MTQVGEQTDYRAEFSADRSSVASASLWLQDISRKNGVPQEALDRLDICLNEVLANVVSHGGTEVRSHPLGLELVFRELNAVSVAELTLSDAGVAFDPTVAHPRPLSASLEEAQPGGLGIVMMRDNADALVYQRVNGLNRLTISVHWPKYDE